MNPIDSKEIGTYISALIKENFNSDRDFCRAYLEAGQGELNEDNIKNMANRISQIKNGKKWIQTYDLPIFSQLLGVSHEEILSAGRCDTSKNSRITNYTVAQSKDPEKWISYIERKEKPILNPDEFGKTVLDYAIEFENYDFIKFLMDEGYI